MKTYLIAFTASTGPSTSHSRKFKDYPNRPTAHDILNFETEMQKRYELIDNVLVTVINVIELGDS